ncbi:MAG TPA: hypothetical protein DD856_17890 [Sulfobacillus sp.]|nr:hypothetical protein [Sulfobacillus sp.]
MKRSGRQDQTDAPFAGLYRREAVHRKTWHEQRVNQVIAHSVTSKAEKFPYNAHARFNRDSLPTYFNLFAFVRNPPDEVPERVEKIVNLAFQNPKFLG